ncbi:MAG: peptidylprolyl isomerase [Oscillospiraceae bacterium]|nr:peptidylprolyl isomerase [Oscillospiraceae bacterium]
MSGVFDNRTDRANRREERNKRELEERKKNKRRAIIVFVVFVAIVAASTFINSKFVRRNFAAISVGGVDFSALEFDYYYNTAYNSYASKLSEEYGEYVEYFLPREGQPLSEQIIDYETGETWADFLYDYTIEQLSEMVQVYNLAQADGYTLPDDIRSAIEDELASIKEYAKTYGESFESLYYMFYGVSYMNENSLRKIMIFSNTINSYRRHIAESYEFSQEEKISYYDENRDNFDNYTFRLFIVSPESVYIEDFEDDLEYDVAYEAAQLEAEDYAKSLVAQIQSEEDFIAAAYEYDDSYYYDPDSTLISKYTGALLQSASNEELAEWIQDSNRKVGDCTYVAVMQEYSMLDSYYVMYFIERDSNEYRLTEMRQVLIMPENVDYMDYLSFDEDVYDDYDIYDDDSLDYDYDMENDDINNDEIDDIEDSNDEVINDGEEDLDTTDAETVDNVENAENTEANDVGEEIEAENNDNQDVDEDTDLENIDDLEINNDVNDDETEDIDDNEDLGDNDVAISDDDENNDSENIDDVLDPFESYMAALEAAEQTAKARADEVLALFVEGDATEETLLDLIELYSDEDTEGGFYGNILQGMMVPEIDSWLFDESRQVGDWELLHTQYGYHLVYFAGFGERYCDYLATEGVYDMNNQYKIVSGLREDKFNEWLETLEPVVAAKKWAFFLTRRV